MNSVLVGMFDSQAAAAHARSQLLSAGFGDDAVTLTGGSSAGPAATVQPGSTQEPHHEGPIARFFDKLFGSDDADSRRSDDAETYQEAFNRGSFGVSVSTVSEAEVEKAEMTLNDCGAIDIDEKAAGWRKEGWLGGLAAAATGTEATAALESGETRTLQEVEEELKVGKRTVARGGVRIFSRMTEVPVEETVRLREEHANVHRKAVDRPATEADFAAFQPGSIEVREMAEEAVVGKTARVTGEVEIGKTATEHEETIRETVRKTEVDVQELDVQPSAAATAGQRLTEASPGTADTPVIGSGIKRM